MWVCNTVQNGPRRMARHERGRSDMRTWLLLHRLPSTAQHYHVRGSGNENRNGPFAE